MLRLWATPLVLLLASGCLSSGDGAGEGQAAADGARSAAGPAWGAPVRVQQYGTAYEPSLAVDGFGRVYVMAHKGEPANEGSRLSSWLWYSEDAGRSWQDLPSPGQAHTYLPGIEGDLAVDADDKVYFVDTYLGDNTFSVWQASDSGVTWESSRSVQGTSGLDDRPWLVAAGSGILYYLGDHLVSQVPAPETLAFAESYQGSRWWFYRSMDGGLTWSPGQALGGIAFGGLVGAEVGNYNGMCNLDADRNTPGLVAAVCTTANGQGLFFLRSTDHGATWRRIDVDLFASRPGYLFPSLALLPDGSAVLAWVDDDGFDDRPGLVKMAVVGADDQVDVQDVTPYDGSFGNLWVAVSPDGRDVLVNVHGSPSRQGPDHVWSLHAIHSRIEGGSLVDVRHSTIDADIGTGAFALGHFIQNSFAPDGSAYVAYQVQVGASAAESEIYVARVPPA